MLSAIAPRWPRAFSSIGIGAIVVYSTFVSAIRQVIFEATTSLPPESTKAATDELWDNALARIQGVEGNLAIAVGFASIFVFYVVGEVIIQGGRAVHHSAFKRREICVRRAKIAKWENDYLWGVFERRENSIDLLMGIFTVVILASALTLIGAFETSGLTWSTVRMCIGFILIGFLLYFIAQRLDWQTQQEIEEYEKLTEEDGK